MGLGDSGPGQLWAWAQGHFSFLQVCGSGHKLSKMRRFLRTGHDPARERLKRDLFQFNKVRGKGGRGNLAWALLQGLGLGSDTA